MNPKSASPNFTRKSTAASGLSGRGHGWARVTGVTVIVLMLVASPCRAGSGLPVLIDSGAGNEFADLYAIAQAARTPGLNLTGVTTSFYSTEASARTVQKLLDLLDRQDVPVACGEVSRGATNLWLQWGEDFKTVSPPKPSACDLLIEMSKQYSGDLFVIATGPLTNLAAAFQKDPGSTGRIRRIYIPGLDCSGQACPSLVVDPESAQLVFATTIPITVFPSEMCRDLVLTRNRVLRIANCHSPLSDTLLNLTSQYSALLPGDEPLITLPSCLAVAYANAPAYTVTETRRYQLVEGCLRETGDPVGRELQVAVSTHPAALMREVISRVEDSNLDFGTTFAHFIVGLNELGKDALVKVQQSLQGGIPVPEVPKEKAGSEAFQIQALAYIGGYMDLLKGIDDPVARRMLDQFKEAFLRVGEIGWWFPDSFYEKWHFEGTPGQPCVFHFGISNSGAQELTEVHGSITLDGHTESVSVASSTKEIRFALTVEAGHLPATWPAKARLKADFGCRGLRYALATEVPLLPLPTQRIAAVRCATDTLAIEVVSPTIASIAVRSIAPAQGISLQKTTPPQLQPAWTSLQVEKRAWDQTEAVRIGFDGIHGSRTDPVSRVALLPVTGEVILVEPDGPSKCSCFAVSKSGKWGWSTDFLNGAESLEFKVLPNAKVTSSTGALYAVVDYFSEGDDLDTFRIEAATESAVYQPLTAWMTKPEDRGWRTDRFRASPMAESMIRSRTLRWLRVQSGRDGDEALRSIHLE